MKLFAIRDLKALRFFQPFSDVDSHSAIRGFSIGVNDTKTMFSKFPDDFALYEFGSFDSNTGIFSLHESPVELVRAIALLNRDESPRPLFEARQ